MSFCDRDPDRQAKGKRTAIPPRSTAREQGMTATAKAKAKFSSRNLNAVYKAPPSKTLEHAGECVSVAVRSAAIDKCCRSEPWNQSHDSAAVSGHSRRTRACHTARCRCADAN